MADTRSDAGSSGCLDTATVAAFVDGSLDPPSRAQVIAHLSSCADCYELVAEVVRTEEELDEPAAKDEERRFGAGAVPPGSIAWSNRRRFAAIGGLVAVAASLLVVVLNRAAPLDPLVSMVGDQRLTMARPSGDFHYGPLRSSFRGSGDTENLELRAEVARLQERAARTAAPKDLHAAGVAQFLAGDSSSGVSLLERTLESSPRDARAHSDLGAAYMTRFIERGDQPDAAAALAAFDKAVSLAPSMKEAWFNKALLLEQLKRPADALAAWTTYLELPDARGWRDEAIRRRDAAQREVSGR